LLLTTVQETLYHCEWSPDHVLTFRRGDKRGSIIATADICPDKEGITLIWFPKDHNTIQLKHGHHSLPRIHEKTSFIYNGKSYCWEGRSELYEKDLDRNVLIANFQESLLPSDYTKVGRLEISRDGNSLIELAVITGLIVQERLDEKKSVTVS